MIYNKNIRFEDEEEDPKVDGDGEELTTGLVLLVAVLIV